MSTSMKTEPRIEMIEALLTRSELEEALKITGRTINRLIRDGELPVPIMVGASRRWRVSDISRYLNGEGRS